jgi:D-alanyl-D-alanine carboxypeptidase (penicillin-binding protein 5/6)
MCPFGWNQEVPVRARRMLITSGLASGLAVVALAAAATGAKAAVQTTRAPNAAIRAIAPDSGPTGVQAPYAEVANAATGADIWSQDPTAEVPMGSITKVMTAYVVIESGDLNQLITVPNGINAYDNKYGASTAGLKPGQQLTAEDLLYALLVPSGCDAAYTLAQAYGPGLSGFIAKMNATAAQLGLSSTHFTDFSGLPDPTEYSTYSDAQDLITLGRDAMRLPLFASIVSLASYQLAAVKGEHPAFSWTTTNPLIGSYPGTIGIKTGDTQAAGDCLLFEAVQNGEDVIGIVLDDPSWTVVTSDAETLLGYGFSNY